MAGRPPDVQCVQIWCFQSIWHVHAVELIANLANYRCPHDEQNANGATRHTFVNTQFSARWQSSRVINVIETQSGQQRA